MIRKKCALHNLGCKVNEYETDAMKQQMQEAGYEIVSFEEMADVYIINTCSVTNIADRKSRQMIHRARKKNPEAVIVAAGCYVQASAAQLLEEGCADIILGNNQKGHLPEMLQEWEKNHKTLECVEDLSRDSEYEELMVSEGVEHTRAFLKIQDGCNQFCSYCIIPFTRGRVRSRRPEDVCREAARLAERGYKEIVLTGIHISSYGLDFDKADGLLVNADREGHSKAGYDPEKSGHLLKLMEELEKIPGIERIRLGSLEPRIITEAFVKRLTELKTFCPHFHLSLQSGCNATLKRMNRHYTTEEFAECCELLRRYFDRPAITTDVITGFAGETEEEFAETRAFLEKIHLYEIHVFPYSIRKGTLAENMPNQNTEQVKKERSRVLLELTKNQSEAYRKECIGKELEVLIEEKVEISGRIYQTGYTKEYVKVAFEGEKWDYNQIVRGTGKALLEYDKVLAE